MEIGRDRLPELTQRWIAIAIGQIAQNLVVGPIFLHNEDNVLDALTHGRQDGSVAGALGGS